MPTAKITGATIEVAPLTYLKELQFKTLFRLGLSIKDDLGKACSVDSELIVGLVHDYCAVSIRVTTAHAISEFLASPTTDALTFRDDFLDFVDALKNESNAIAFDDIIKAVQNLDKPQAEDYQHPTKPTDPNS